MDSEDSEDSEVVRILTYSDCGTCGINTVLNGGLMEAWWVLHSHESWLLFFSILCLFAGWSYLCRSVVSERLPWDSLCQPVQGISTPSVRVFLPCSLNACLRFAIANMQFGFAFDGRINPIYDIISWYLLTMAHTAPFPDSSDQCVTYLRSSAEPCHFLVFSVPFPMTLLQGVWSFNTLASYLGWTAGTAHSSKSVGQHSYFAKIVSDGDLRLHYSLNLPSGYFT